MEKPLTNHLSQILVLLSISLAIGQSSTTNDIVPSTTLRIQSTNILSQTPSLLSASPTTTSDIQSALPNLKTSGSSSSALSLNTSTSTLKSTSHPGNSAGIMSSGTVSPSPVFTSYLSVSATVTVTPSSGALPTNSVHVENTPSTSAVRDGEVVNVTCSIFGNVTDCKTYNGQDDWTLPTPVVIGIACGSAAIVLLIVIALAICCARKKQRLSGSKADLSAYWEDNVTLSYINGHVDVPRDYPDEMISLDNDSFLNSLDNMSFTNVWTAENAKHTNF